MELGVYVRMAPLLGSGTKSRLVPGPIVERSRGEIGSTRPDDDMNLGIDNDLSKCHRVAERPVKLALENSLEINGARQAIVEAQTQRIRSDEIAGRDAENWMVHGAPLYQRIDLGRLAALLQKRLIGEQLLLVKLGPSLAESPGSHSG